MMSLTRRSIVFTCLCLTTALAVNLTGAGFRDGDIQQGVVALVIALTATVGSIVFITDKKVW